MDNILALVVLAVITSMVGVMMFVSAVFGSLFWTVVMFILGIISAIAFILQFVKVEKEEY